VIAPATFLSFAADIRDRMGIKLYASEAKAFLCYPAYEFLLDHGRLSEFFRSVMLLEPAQLV
jgi:hypothetical protein